VLLFTGIMVVGVSGPCLSPDLPGIAADFNTTLATITQVTSGSQIITSAAIVPFSTALSNKYGKRPIYLAGFLIATIGCIINAVITNLAGLGAARVIQGLAVTPIEMILNASVGDVFFVHQRGVRISLLAFSVLASFSLSAIISGYVIEYLGWRWCFWLLAIGSTPNTSPIPAHPPIPSFLHFWWCV
jgi:MFS family permease